MFYLRKAVDSDMDILYAWANDPDVRRNSFNSAPIPYEAHQAWFSRMMEDDAVYQFILMDESVPVGQIRLNVDGDEAEIGYSIASRFRGKGFGQKILQLIIQEVKFNIPEIKKLVAKVKPDNTASKKLFESTDFSMKCLCYTLAINDCEGLETAIPEKAKDKN